MYMREYMRMAAILALIVLIISVQSVIADIAFTDTHEIKNWNTEINNSIVQIYTVSRDPYYMSPWVMLPENRIVGTGFIIKGNRILTNAHVVANHMYIQVRNARDSRKYRARVLHISHEADLALLTVDDNRFFTDVRPLVIDVLPDTQQKVLVYGFPEGESLTITEGIFSGLGHRLYTHSSQSMLAGEILSDIKKGHSGGPVMFRNRVIGAMMQANRAGSIAHMVPGPVVKHFLSDVSDGRYHGFPELGLIAENLENDVANKECGFTRNRKGVIVSHVITGSPAEGLIRKGDELMSLNGYPVYVDGTIELEPETRTHFNYAVEMNQVGEIIEADIMRNRKLLTVSLKLDKTAKAFQLVSGKHYDRQPTYFIYAGIIFSPLTINYLSESSEVPEELIAEMSKWPTMDRKEVVVALEVLPAEVNRGYHKIKKRVITEINGSTFRDFHDFFELVSSTSDPYIAFGSSSGDMITIDRQLAEESHKHILETYSIRADRSADLQRLHAAKDKAREIYQ